MSEGMYKADPDGVAKVLQLLFRRLTQDMKLEPEQWLDVGPDHFIGWLKKKDYDPAELAAQLKVPESSAAFVIRLCDDPVGANRLVATWANVVLSSRETKHEVLSVQYIALVHWDDGVIAPINTYVHRDIVSGPITDATVVAAAQSTIPQLVDPIYREGLDTIHDAQEEEGAVNPNAVLALIRELISGDTSVDHITQEEITRINKLLQLMDGMFLREVDPEMVADVEAERLKIEEAQKASDGLDSDFEGGIEG
jgi:hypothetical protein